MEEELQVPEETASKQKRPGRPKQKDAATKPKQTQSSNQEVPDNKKSAGKSRTKGKSVAEILGDPPALNENGLIDGGTLGA